MREINYGYKYALLSDLEIERNGIIIEVDGKKSEDCLDFAVRAHLDYGLKIAKLKIQLICFKFHYVNIRDDGAIFDFTGLLKISVVQG